MSLFNLPTVAESAALARERGALQKGVPRPIAKKERAKSKKEKDEAVQRKLVRRMERQIAKQQPCPICQKPIRHARAKSCSPKCGGRLRKLKNRPERPCVTCGKAFLPRQHRGVWAKCCSSKCQRAYIAPVQILVTCAQCARQFHRRDGQHVRRYRVHFCNIVCRGKFVRGENHALYRGDCDPNRGRRWTVLAESIRQRDSYQCRRCGKTQAENGRKLDVDHVKPWRAFEDKAEANDPANLVTLCKTCHRRKTNVAERAWLKGDVLAMQQYRQAVGL